MALRPTVAVQNLPRQGRRIRRPQHTFQLRSKPYQIQPFLIAPVLPGETMRSGLLQARVISDPIKNRLLGWWKEYYFFYVKHRDLDIRDELEQMVLNYDWTPAAINTDTSEVKHYFSAGADGLKKINWVHHCLKRVTEEFFRDEGENWLAASLENLPLASIGDTRGFWHSATVADEVDFRDVELEVGADDAFTMGELDDAMREFDFLRQSGFSRDMSYEDYLRTYGIRPAQAEEPHKPELIRFVRNWQYPVSAIDPTDGSAASAVQWSVAERMDKDRFFKEPGFIFGVTVTRPKVYLNRQTGNGVTLLDGLREWLPAIMADDVNSSLKLVADTHSPIGDVTDAGGVWVDVKDLFLYGDQFVNFSLATADAGMVALPTAALQKKYPSGTDIGAMFVGETPSATISEDGIVTLMIAGRQVDTSA